MEVTKRFLQSLGLPFQDSRQCPDSPLRFPDGGQYRVEIASTEMPSALHAVLEEAGRLRVPVHRVSQGTGMMLLTDAEITEMMDLGLKNSIEVNLFIGPRATYDIGAQTYAPGGKSIGWSLRGADQLFYGLLDLRRAVRLGLRSVLLSDLGLLQVVSKMRAAGELPAELIIKTSVQMAPSNPAAARILQDLGADTINVSPDLTIPQIAAMRAALTVPIDFYIEAPDAIGGFIRFYEAAELIRVASPVYLKFGLRNAPDIYPSGSHMESTVVALSRERVRRAAICRELLGRYSPEIAASPLGSKDLGIPAPPR